MSAGEPGERRFAVKCPRADESPPREFQRYVTHDEAARVAAALQRVGCPVFVEEIG